MDCFLLEGVENADGGLGKQHLKRFPINVIHNTINIETFTDRMVLVHSTKQSIAIASWLL